MSARPQEYEDYEQQTARPAARNQQQPQPQQQQKKLKVDDRETTTWIPIIQYDKSQATDGSYKTQWDRWKWHLLIVLKQNWIFQSYETGNNILASESGYLKDLNEDNPAGTLVQKGSYSYESPDGQVSLAYILKECISLFS